MREVIPAAIAALPWKIIFILVALATFGGLVLYSAAGGSWKPWAMPHLIRFWLLLGVAVLIIRRLPLDFFRQFALPAYLASLAMLLLVELIGQIGGGSQRWLNLGVLTLQPSELTKIAIVLLLARFFEGLPAGYRNTWRAILPPLIVISAPAALVLIQPDLDAALVLAVTGAAIMFLAGLPLRYIIGGSAVASLCAPFAYFFLLQPYQQERLASFIAPESDPLGMGYHVLQSKVAIGAGGFWGRGFLEGSQARLNYLPEHHTDLVFAALVEEWGLVGGLAVMLTYYALLKWSFKVALSARSNFGRLTAMGMVVTLFLYIAMNMLTATGLTPVMGMPLPLISHGGSAMLTVMIAVGILMAIELEEVRSRPVGGIWSLSTK